MPFLGRRGQPTDESQWLREGFAVHLKSRAEAQEKARGQNRADMKPSPLTPGDRVAIVTNRFEKLCEGTKEDSWPL
jgi:hypothetical protein